MKQLLSVERCGVYALMLFAFLLTLWRFGANQCWSFLIVLALCYGPYRKRLFSKTYLRHPLFGSLFLLIAYAMVSVSYSESASLGKAPDGLSMYFKLFFLCVIPLFIRTERARYWVCEALILGVAVNAFLSTLFYFHAPWVGEVFAQAFQNGMNATFAINPLQMIFVVIVALWILVMRYVRGQGQWHDVLLFIFLSLYLWFINMERTGYLLFLLLGLLVVWQHGNKKHFTSALCFLPFCLLGLYLASPSVKARIDLGAENIRAFYHVTDIENIGVNNSLGLRLAFLSESLQVIHDHPFFGTGVGSFRAVYMKRFHQGGGQVEVNDPHNAYTEVAFELGFCGLALYFFWLYQVWRSFKAYPCEIKWLLQGLWWAFVGMGFTDSNLALNAVMGSFITVFALYFQPNRA